MRPGSAAEGGNRPPKTFVRPYHLVGRPCKVLPGRSVPPASSGHGFGMFAAPKPPRMSLGIPYLLRNCDARRPLAQPAVLKTQPTRARTPSRAGRSLGRRSGWAPARWGLTPIVGLLLVTGGTSSVASGATTTTSTSTTNTTAPSVSAGQGASGEPVRSLGAGLAIAQDGPRLPVGETNSAEPPLRRAGRRRHPSDDARASMAFDVHHSLAVARRGTYCGSPVGRGGTGGRHGAYVTGYVSTWPRSGPSA